MASSGSGSGQARFLRPAINMNDRSFISSASRTERILAGPIVPTLLRLAAPTIVVMVVQAAVNVAETYFVSRLGTAELAGISMVFPVLMLVQMMSAAGTGGGVAAAIARALGAGRREDAEALVVHALVIAVVFGMATTVVLLAGGPALYRALGGAGEAQQAALAYSDVVFAAALLLWVVNILCAVLRGIGNMMAPAIVILSGAVIVVPLSPCLIFGWGPFAPMGIVGAGIAVATYYLLGSVALVLYLRSGRGGIRLRLRGVRLRRQAFEEILGVGALSSLMTIQPNIAVVLVTGVVGGFGTAALAGYGMASRLDYLVMPLLFGLGSATVTLVGASIGAGQLARARRAAWMGAIVAGATTEAIGLLAAWDPGAWIGLFSDEPDALGAGSEYLRIVGPVYGCAGVGILLYFASQGAGRMLWPFSASLLRLLMIAGGCWLANGIVSLFLVIALAMAAFGAINALGIEIVLRRRPVTTDPAGTIGAPVLAGGQAASSP